MYSIIKLLFKRNIMAKYPYMYLINVITLGIFLFNYFYIGIAYAEESSYPINFTNANSPLYTPTYDGSNEAVHPSVLYIDKSFCGYKYWMAITPYPSGNDDFENPQILVSNDGKNFCFFKTLNSYLAIPKDVKIGGHYSDVNLCFANNELELYFRYNPHLKGTRRPNNRLNYVYVMKTTDGLHWSDKKLVLSNDTFKEKYNYVSPTITYEDGVYSIWFSNYSSNLYYTKTKDWIKFEPIMTCEFVDKATNIKIWHHDIIKTNLGYEAIISAYTDNSGIQSLYYSHSQNGINFTGFDLVLKPSTSDLKFDNVTLYKSSLVKLPNKYLLYYSAKNKDGHWHIGIAKN